MGITILEAYNRISNSPRRRRLRTTEVATALRTTEVVMVLQKGGGESGRGVLRLNDGF
ncbi:N-acetylmuramic acid 6-phosphate etherase [Sesbania bispinosa]|nr:N-acetylmuramic acid 6-phosphate etherase [Sesbania bispinosa]